MGVSWKLGINYIKNNKKRAILIGICILISTALITTVLLLLNNYKEYMITKARNESNWEVRIWEYNIWRSVKKKKT